jgi:hypothetical protein
MAVADHIEIVVDREFRDVRAWLNAPAVWRNEIDGDRLAI